MKTGKNPESFCAVLEVLCNDYPSVQPLLAIGACTLKCTGGRLSIRAQLQHLLFCVPVVREPIRAFLNASFNLFNHFYTPKPTEIWSTYSNLGISNWFEIWKYVIFGFSKTIGK